MAEIKITEKMVLEAKSYMPIASKEAMARLMAGFCIEHVANPKSTDTQPLPGMNRENRQMKQQFVMGVLAKFYLGQEIEEQLVKAGENEPRKLAFCMDMASYDEWAGSHVINQLERLKKSKTPGVANKVFDLMYDLKGFENMLFGSIREGIELYNDPCARLSEMLMLQTSEQVMAATKKMLNEVQGELKELSKK